VESNSNVRTQSTTKTGSSVHSSLSLLLAQFCHCFIQPKSLGTTSF